MIRRLTTGIAIGAAALLLGGVAYASIPGAGGVISGCHSTFTGLLRIVDAEAGQRCRYGEQAVSWNQQGPKGDPGPAGTARAYAYVSPKGVLDPAKSKGIRGVAWAVTPIGPWTNVWCFDLDFEPNVAIATGLITNPPDVEVRAIGPNAGQKLFTGGTSGPVTCQAPHTDAAVSIWGPNQIPVFTPAGFSVVFN